MLDQIHAERVDHDRTVPDRGEVIFDCFPEPPNRPDKLIGVARSKESVLESPDPGPGEEQRKATDNTRRGIISSREQHKVKSNTGRVIIERDRVSVQGIIQGKE